MKKILFVLFFSLLLFSCTIEEKRTVTLKLENHKYEFYSSYPMWYKLCFFDGLSVKEKVIPPRVTSIDIDLYGTGFRPIIAIPLDTLVPLGAFYEVGGKEELLLTLDNGIFSKCLVDAARYYPKAVSRFSISWLRKNGINSQTIDQVSFLENLFNGTINEKNIKKCKIYNLTLSSLPVGLYLSDNPRLPDIKIRELGEEIPISLFPGVYHLWNYQRDLLFTIIVTEEGEIHSTLGNLNPLFSLPINY